MRSSGSIESRHGRRRQARLLGADGPAITSRYATDEIGLALNLSRGTAMSRLAQATQAGPAGPARRQQEPARRTRIAGGQRPARSPRESRWRMSLCRSARSPAQTTSPASWSATAPSRPTSPVRSRRTPSGGAWSPTRSLAPCSTTAPSTTRPRRSPTSFGPATSTAASHLPPKGRRRRARPRRALPRRPDERAEPLGWLHPPPHAQAPGRLAGHPAPRRSPHLDHGDGAHLRQLAARLPTRPAAAGPSAHDAGSTAGSPTRRSPTPSGAAAVDTVPVGRHRPGSHSGRRRYRRRSAAVLIPRLRTGARSPQRGGEIDDPCADLGRALLLGPVSAPRQHRGVAEVDDRASDGARKGVDRHSGHDQVLVTD